MRYILFLLLFLWLTICSLAFLFSYPFFFHFA